MSETISFISFIVFIFAFFAVSINIVRMRSKNIKLKLQIIDLIQRNEVLKASLDSRESKDVEKTEGFLNFVTQSRDWAFEYIEEVQNELKTFIDEVKPEIDYFDEYGVIGSAYPHYYSMKKISQAYKKIESLLPEDYDKTEKL